MEEQKTYDLKGVEIFATGKWNGDLYTESDLDAMAQSFSEIGEKIKPYVKLGHSKNQAILQADGYPAAGWIKNVKRVGKKLVCDMVNLPEKIYTLISNKAYGRFSSEIFWNLKHGEKTYSRVLKAVALLGADTPEVQTLDDFISLYTIENTNFDNDKNYHELKTYISEAEIMDEKVLQEIMAKIDALQAQIDEIKGGGEKEEMKKDEMACGPDEEKKKLMSEIESLKGKIKQVEYDKKHAEVHAYLDRKLEEGAISPAQYDHFSALCMSDAEIKNYTTKDKKLIDGTAFDMVRGIVEGSKVVEFGMQTHSAKVDKKISSGVNESVDELDSKIKEYAKNNKVSYSEAYDKIAKGE